MDLADHDLAGRRNLVHCQRCAQRVIGAWERPIVQGAVGIGFTQFGTRIDSIFGLGTSHRRPEEQGAVLGIEVFALVAIDQARGLDGGWGAAHRHAQVPGSEINHVQFSRQARPVNGRKNQPDSFGSGFAGRSL
ncbi:hypothetical protein D3C76_1302600 [compost metagenome]